MGNPVRVLHICGSITASGGVGSLLMNYYRNLDKDKVQFDFLTHNSTSKTLVDEINGMGGNVYKITPKSESLVRNVKETFQFINRRSVHQVIHIHTASTTSFMYLLIAKLAKKRKRIVHSHGTNLEMPDGSFQHQIHYVLQPILKALATDLFACSQAAGVWLYGRKGINEVIIIKNAVDAEHFAFSSSKSDFMKHSMNLEGKFVIGNIGRFVYAKNHDFMIEIFNEIVKIQPNAVLVLIGNGELRNEIEQKVFELGLKEKVKFLGVRRDIPDLLQAMDIFLLPSRYEGLPVVLIEAQASGLKIFATDTITEEVEITDLVTRLPLKESPCYWAKRIIEESKELNRKNIYPRMIESGYDIKQNAKWLENFYIM